MKRRAVEICKTIVIILLLASLAFLSLTAVFYSGAELSFLTELSSRLRGAPYQPPVKAPELALMDAAYPVLISVRTGTGRTSFWGDPAQQSGVYETLGGYLAEALDTAARPAPVEEEALVESALGDSVLFRFPGEVPIPVLAAWLDASCEAGLSADLFVLAVQEGAVRLLLGGSAGCYAMDTQAAAEPLQRALQSYPDDGTRVAAEAGEGGYGHLAPLTLVDPSVESLAAAHGSNPCDETFLKTAAAALGFNPYGDAGYRDAMGNMVFTEPDCALRASADGVMTLTSQPVNGRFRAAGGDDGACIEYVRSLLSEMEDGTLGDAVLQFTGVRHEEGETVVEFSYLLSGLPVLHDGGAAVEARFNGADLTRLRFRARAYALSQTERIDLLPPAQAAAVLEAGASLRLAYADRGDGALGGGWLR